jgi:hypothetical protein
MAEVTIKRSAADLHIGQHRSPNTSALIDPPVLGHSPHCVARAILIRSSRVDRARVTIFQLGGRAGQSESPVPLPSPASVPLSAAAATSRIYRHYRKKLQGASVTF